MMESALELAKKSTASVQALLSQLLEIYDARTLAHLLNAQGDSHWSPAILKRLVTSERAGHRLSDGEYGMLQNLLPRPPADRYNGTSSKTPEDAVDFRGLLDAWRAGGTSPRTATEYAVRLPIDAAARLAALADMFPGRTREQLITELLSVALDELAAAMPYEPGRKVISHDDQGDPVFEDVGMTPKLLELTRKHQKRLQADLPK